MQSQIQLEFNITLGSEQGLYSSNLDVTILRSLREMYAERCVEGQYIVSIDSIVKRSLPNVLKRDLDAKVRIFVIANVTVERYDAHDVVCGLKVSKVIPKGKLSNFDSLQCSSDHCKVLMQLDDGEHHYHIGDIIPVRVGAALLKSHSDQVLIKAIPFVPLPPDNVVYRIGATNAAAVQQFIDSATSVAETDASYEGNTRFEFFKALLPTYKTKQAKVGKQIELMELLTNSDKYKGLYIWIDRTHDLTDLKVSVLTQAQVNERNFVVSALDSINDREPTIAAIHAIVTTFTKYVATLKTLTQSYADPNTFERHQYVWDLYANHKL